MKRSWNVCVNGKDVDAISLESTLKKVME